MIKKIYHISSAFLLLLATTGIGISSHYCGDFWVSTSIFSEAETCCDDGSCCTTENNFFQVDDDFSAPTISASPGISEFDLPGSTINGEDLSPVGRIVFTQKNINDPPPRELHTALSLRQSFLL
jgi:hypothetical protein